MAKEGDMLITFWNQESRGTYHMIETMKKLNKKSLVYDFKGNLLFSFHPK